MEKPARIAALLRHGGYTLSFVAPSAGRLAISWSVRSSHSKPPLQIATVTVVIHGRGRVTVKVVLTAKGRRLLRHSRRLTVIENASFTPSGGNPVRASRTIHLRR